MSFLSYILNKSKNINRENREDIKFPCKYQIYTETFDTNAPLYEGVIINLSIKGFGVITTPPLQNLNEEDLKKNKYKIYIEINVTEINSTLKIHGELRWVKSKTDLKKPYSEIGILLKTTDEDSKTALIDAACKIPK